MALQKAKVNYATGFNTSVPKSRSFINSYRWKIADDELRIELQIFFYETPIQIKFLDNNILVAQ